MFRTKGDDTIPPELADEPLPAEPIVKKPAAEARAFQPSTFASRRAAATHKDTGRRLVSMGQSQFTQRNTSTGEIELIDVELYYDRDRPRNRFARFPGYTNLVPLQDDSRPAEQPQSLGTLKNGRLGRPNVSAYPDSPPDLPPRAV